MQQNRNNVLAPFSASETPRNALAPFVSSEPMSNALLDLATRYGNGPFEQNALLSQFEWVPEQVIPGHWRPKAPMRMGDRKTRIDHRSAVTGHFITKEQADRNPRESITERNPLPKKK